MLKLLKVLIFLTLRNRLHVALAIFQAVSETFVFVPVIVRCSVRITARKSTQLITFHELSAFNYRVLLVLMHDVFGAHQGRHAISRLPKRL